MKLRSVRYLTVEGIKNTWVNRLMSLASVGVLVACMVMIGLAYLIAENVNNAIGNVEQQNIVMVYMKDYNWALYSGKEQAASEAETSEEAGTATKESDTKQTEETDAASDEKTGEEADKNGIRPSDYVIHDDEEGEALCDKIREIDNVKKVEYISKEEGLERAKADLPEEDKELFVYLEEEEYGNPIQAAAEVTLENMDQFDETLKEIEKLDGVGSITSQADLAEKISAVKKGLAFAGVLIIAILVAISLVIVSNTIRITMYNRKLEIGIMKAVGATNSFVRIPFIVEGIIIGIVSALLSEVVVYFCYRVATERIKSVLNTDQIVSFSQRALWMLLIFAAIGVFSGVLGSAFMIRKYLRREGSEFSALQ